MTIPSWRGCFMCSHIFRAFSRHFYVGQKDKENEPHQISFFRGELYKVSSKLYVRSLLRVFSFLLGQLI